MSRKIIGGKMKKIKIYILCYRDYNDLDLHEDETPDVKIFRTYKSEGIAKLEEAALKRLYNDCVWIENAELNEEE